MTPAQPRRTIAAAAGGAKGVAMSIAKVGDINIEYYMEGAATAAGGSPAR